MSDSQGIPGQQGLTSANGQFNRIGFHVKQLLGKTTKLQVVKVIKVKNGGGAVAEAGRLTVQNLVNQVDGLGKPTAHGNVYDIPYVRVQGGKNAVIIDPEEGDIGIVVVADRDISKVKKTKAAANPGSRRRHDVADGLYIGGILNPAPTQWVRFFSGGLEIADSNGNKMTMTSSGVAFTTVGDGLTNNKDIVAGKGGGDQVSLQNHLHQDAGGSGNSGKPVAGT